VLTIANVEQAAAWDGGEGDHWTEQSDRYDVAGSRHLALLLDKKLISAGDEVLDLGCGTGRSTIEVARQAAPGSAVGVDLSARMLQRARELASGAGVANVEFEQADAQVHPFQPDAFDKVVSKFGAMFFGDPVAAFTNVARATRSGGRLAILTWRELARNEWLTALRGALALGRALPEPPPGAPGPFAFADPDHVRPILEKAGFADVHFEPLDEPLELGRDAEDAFTFVRSMGIVKGLTEDLDPAARTAALSQLRTTLASHETDQGVLFGTSTWLITARRP
jgi:SAM-dependent methyltransferase